MARRLPVYAGPPRKRGAQPGNLNALKHGRRSRQFQHLTDIINHDPRAQHLFRALAQKRRRRTNSRNYQTAKLPKRLIASLPANESPAPVTLASLTFWAQPPP